MERYFEIMIDLSNPRQNIICLKQHDRGATTVKLSIMNNGVKFDLSDAAFVSLKGVKPDDTVIYAGVDFVQDDDGNNTNVLMCNLPEQVATVAGKSTYEVTLTDQYAGTITTFDFYISVEALLFDEEDYFSESDVSGFRVYLIRALNAAQRTEEFAEAFRQAYGNESEILENIQALKTYYEAFFEELEEALERGDFNGARGIQGERGADGVISEIGLVIGFEEHDGDLYVYYSEDSTLNWTTDSDGNLIVSS